MMIVSYYKYVYLKIVDTVIQELFLGPKFGIPVDSVPAWFTQLWNIDTKMLL